MGTRHVVTQAITRIGPPACTRSKRWANSLPRGGYSTPNDSSVNGRSTGNVRAWRIPLGYPIAALRGRLLARNGRSMRADECLFLVEERSYSGHPRNDRVCPQAVFGSIHRTRLSALFTDRAMEAWYHLSIA